MATSSRSPLTDDRGTVAVMTAVMLAALDTGSAFEGMGASREATFSALAEPVFFLALTVASFLVNFFACFTTRFCRTFTAWCRSWFHHDSSLAVLFSI